MYKKSTLHFFKYILFIHNFVYVFIAIDTTFLEACQFVRIRMPSLHIMIVNYIYIYIYIYHVCKNSSYMMNIWSLPT